MFIVLWLFLDYTKMTEQEREEKILRRKEALGLTVQKITMDMMDKVFG